MSTFSDRAVVAGVGVAAVLGGVLALIGTVISPDWQSPVAYVLPLSFPVGILMAARHARAVVSSPRFPVGRVVVMSLQALVIGALLTGVASVGIGLVTGTGWVASGWVASVWQAIGAVVATAFLGIVFVGIPVLAVIVPIVGLWAVLLRRLARGGLVIHQAGELRRAARWGMVAVGSFIGSHVAWPLFSLIGAGDLGWFLALVLWLVLLPIALILTFAGARRALTVGSATQVS